MDQAVRMRSLRPRSQAGSWMSFCWDPDSQSTAAIAMNNPLTVRLAKHCVDAGLDTTRQGAMAIELLAIQENLRQGDWKGAIAACNPGPTSSVPFVIGSMPLTQASVNTGSITNQVRNSESEIIRMLGGDCWSPMACLRIDRTVTMKGKQVTMTASPGAMLRTVTSAISVSDWPVRET